MDGFNFWDSNDGDAITYPTTVSQQSDQEAFGWTTGIAETAGSQSPSTTAPAEFSWVGSGAPQVVRDITEALKAGIGLSLAKDQLLFQRDYAKIGLDVAKTRALADANNAAGQLTAQHRAANLAAQYPLGIPFGKTRNDQMLLLAAAAVGLVLLVNKRGQ